MIYSRVTHICVHKLLRGRARLIFFIILWNRGPTFVPIGYWIIWCFFYLDLRDNIDIWQKSSRFHGNMNVSVDENLLKIDSLSIIVFAILAIHTHFSILMDFFPSNLLCKNYRSAKIISGFQFFNKLQLSWRNSIAILKILEY